MSGTGGRRRPRRRGSLSGHGNIVQKQKIGNITQSNDVSIVINGKEVGVAQGKNYSLLIIRPPKKDGTFTYKQGDKVTIITQLNNNATKKPVSGKTILFKWQCQGSQTFKAREKTDKKGQAKIEFETTNETHTGDYTIKAKTLKDYGIEDPAYGYFRLEPKTSSTRTTVSASI